MKKILIIIVSLAIVLGGCSSDTNSDYAYNEGDTLPAGTYTVGVDLANKSYMFNLLGESSFKIIDDAGEEVYFNEIEAGQRKHEMSLPLDENYVIEITGDGGLELV